MPHPMRILAALSATALTIAASGCGASDAVEAVNPAKVDVAQAATATAAKKTAAYTMAVKVAGGGLPSNIDITFDGVTDLSAPRLTMHTDFTKLVQSFGGPPLANGALDLRIDGTTAYVKPPSIPGLTIPGGKEWVSIDLQSILKAVGVDSKSLGGAFKFDPAGQLQMLKSLKGLKKIGTETVNGAQTTHYRGILHPLDVIPAAQRHLLDQLPGDAAKLLSKGFPVEFWIDDQAVARRMKFTESLPVPGAAGTLTAQMDLTKFGVPIDVSKPASVFDATDTVNRLVQQFGGSLLKTA